MLVISFPPSGLWPNLGAPPSFHKSIHHPCNHFWTLSNYVLFQKLLVCMIALREYLISVSANHYSGRFACVFGGSVLFQFQPINNLESLYYWLVGVSYFSFSQSIIWNVCMLALWEYLISDSANHYSRTFVCLPGWSVLFQIQPITTLKNMYACLVWASYFRFSQSLIRKVCKWCWLM